MIREYPVGKTEDGIQPIIYVKSRIKSPESMMRKLWKKGWETDADTALKKTNDAVGVRVICSFEEEVYQVTEWFEAKWLPQSAFDRKGKKRRIRRHDRRNTASDDRT